MTGRTSLTCIALSRLITVMKQNSPGQPPKYNYPGSGLGLVDGGGLSCVPKLLSEMSESHESIRELFGCGEVLGLQHQGLLLGKMVGGISSSL